MNEQEKTTGASPVVPVLVDNVFNVGSVDWSVRTPYAMSLDFGAAAPAVVPDVDYRDPSDPKVEWMGEFKDNTITVDGPMMVVPGGSAFSDTFEKMLLANLREAANVPFHAVEFNFATQVMAMNHSLNARVEEFLRGFDHQTILADIIAQAFMRRQLAVAVFRIKSKPSHRLHGGSMRQKKRHHYAKQR